MLTVNTGSAAVTATYDALDRMVENNAGGTYSEFIFGPTGAKLAEANGQTLVKAFIALPGGAKAIYTSSGLAYYRHSDWLGSSRLTSTASRTLYSSSAYAPFGEQYKTSGTADASFTSQNSDTVSSLYDFEFRESRRWISPDPAGMAAVNSSNPQSWNRYTYVLNDPLRLVDRLGLWCEFFLSVQGDNAWYTLLCGSNGGGPGDAERSSDDLPRRYVVCAGATRMADCAAFSMHQPHPANNDNWWGTFFRTFANGVLHGVRQPGQSFWQCVNQNANETTGGAVNAISTQAVAGALAVGVAIGVTATVSAPGVSTSAFQQVSGISLPSISLAQQFGSWVALMGGSSLGVAKVAGYVTGGAASGVAVSTVAVAGGISGLAIGSAINCR